MKRVIIVDYTVVKINYYRLTLRLVGMNII